MRSAWGFVPGALKNFEQDKIADQQRLPAGCDFPLGLLDKPVNAIA
jgi:hypothetical protein